VPKNRGEPSGSNSTSNTIKHKPHNSDAGTASQSQSGGNTVININIDNRGGQTSSYSHLIPGQIGHLNVNMGAEGGQSSAENNQRRGGDEIAS
jgi:hypothetical protein